MRRPRWKPVLAAVSAVLLLGAAATVVGRMTSAPDPSHYFPLAPGARWEYEVTGSPFDRLVSAVMETRDEAGRPAYVMEATVLDTGGIWHVATYSYVDDGILLYDMAWEEGGAHYVQSEPVHLLKAPLREGRTWSWTTTFSDATGHEPDMVLEASFIVGPTGTVDVPAGSFEGTLRITRLNRFSVRGHWYEVSQVLYYAPGVGLVLEEHYRDGQQVGRCALTDWSPGTR